MRRKESNSNFLQEQAVFVWSVNLTAEPGRPAQNVSSMLRWMDRAARAREKESGKRRIHSRGAPHFILFPEMCISGYINSASALRRVRKEVEGSIDTVLHATTKIPDTVVLAGHPFYAGTTVRIRHSAMQNGAILFSHDKSVLSPGEKKVFTTGERPVPFSVNFVSESGGTNGGRKSITCGIQLCYENHFPELAAGLADDGCDILFAPFATPRERPRQKYRRMLRFLPARGYDNSCFVVSCNIIQDFPRSGRSPGAAMIINPKGRIIAESTSRREGCCRAVLDLSELERIRTSAMGYFRGNYIEFSAVPRSVK